ncbi:hypothetical protein C9196_24115 [Escherichia coli]|nr:hypothetical protein C9196_24115 [Escherichia coli]
MKITGAGDSRCVGTAESRIGEVASILMEIHQIYTVSINTPHLIVRTAHMVQGEYGINTCFRCF